MDSPSRLPPVKLREAVPELAAAAPMVAVQEAPDAKDSSQVVPNKTRPVAALGEDGLLSASDKEVKVSVTLLSFVMVTVLLPTVEIVVSL